jgi:hypothetical protein
MTVGKSLDKLLSISTDSPLRFSSETAAGTPVLNVMLWRELAEFLRRRNGFYAFESALHVFPLQSAGNVYGLDGWNAPDTWVGCYEDLANGCFFFAEDIFGNQFCIKGNDICSFDAETGATKALASNLEGWAAAILSDYQFLTGHKLAHEWQVRNGRIQDNKRLVPKIPFVGGGAYVVDNLYAGDTITSLRYRGEFAVQIRDVPDGGKIRLRLVD